MNASPPSLTQTRPHVAVIGAGPGGLAIAMQLAAAGLRVTIYEKDAVVGGRTRTVTAPGGYRFDIGPTFFLYPRVLEEIFAACGTRLEDEVDLIRLDPQYRLIFEGAKPVTIDATPDLARMEAEVAKINPADAAGVRSFMAENRVKLEAFRPVLERPFHGVMTYLAPEVMNGLRYLRPWLSLDQELQRHFADPRTRLAFSFQSKYLGMSPFRCPSMFSILSFLEYEHGVFHPRGGCGVVSEAMARVAQNVGVDIRLNTKVDRIVFEGRRAVGVEVDGRLQTADAVVVNADFAHAIPGLMEEEQRPQWPDKKIAEARYSCSTFMLYLGLEGPLDLAHHTVLLAEDYENNLAQIEAGIIPRNPSLYVQAATGVDPSMAPKGHSTLYVLVPVPNLLGGADWAQEAPAYRRLVLERLKLLGLTDIESRIRYEHMLTPQDWRDEYAVGHGATFNLAHNVRQMMHFRPRNRFGRAKGVYLVGGGTHPGSGLPVIYEGARISADLLLEDLGLQRLPRSAALASTDSSATGS
ncbi:MAG: phytoene desaturase [Pseudomonadota bacterium]